MTVSGAIIKAIAAFFLIGLIGFRDESASYQEPAPKPSKMKGGAAAAVGHAPPPAGAVCPPGTVLVSHVPHYTTGGTTTTAAGTLGSPVSPTGGFAPVHTVPPV